MQFNECQKSIVQYIISHYKNPDILPIPCIETLQSNLKGKYSTLEIRENTLELVSSGVLIQYSFHEYLDFTETFKSTKSYKLLRKSMEE